MTTNGAKDPIKKENFNLVIMEDGYTTISYIDSEGQVVFLSEESMNYICNTISKINQTLYEKF